VKKEVLLEAMKFQKQIDVANN